MFAQGAKKEAEVVNSEGFNHLDRSTATIIAASGEMALGAAKWQSWKALIASYSGVDPEQS
jgi:hypothetical protein